MRRLLTSTKLIGVCAVSAIVVAFIGGMALAESTPTKLCVPETAGKPVKTPSAEGKCPSSGKTTYRLVELGKEGPEGKKGAPAPFVVVRARGTTAVIPGEPAVAIPLTNNTWVQQANEDVFAFGGVVKMSWPEHVRCSVTVEVRINGEPGLKANGYSSGSSAKEETLHLEVEPGYGRGFEFETGETHTDTITAQVHGGCEEGAGHASVESVSVDGIGGAQ